MADEAISGFSLMVRNFRTPQRQVLTGCREHQLALKIAF